MAPLSTAKLLRQIADALHYAHTNGVIHRDLKPANIILARVGPASERVPADPTDVFRPKIMDFGLAKQDSDESALTEDGQVLGTPAYMSPEQARGESHSVDARSDVYSLGVILYELLTGERPFRGTRRMLLRQVLDDDPRPPRQLNDKVPRSLEVICLKCLSKAPTRRYSTAQEFAADLTRFLNDEPIQAKPAGPVERLVRGVRRHPLITSLFLAVSLGAALGLLHLSRLSEELVRTSALESAAQHSEILEVVNDRYSSQVIDRVQGHGVSARADYQREPGAVPLPATFTIDLGDHLAERNESGVRVRLYSDYPFRTRSDGGPRDEFERDALDELRRNPDQPFYRFEDLDGRPVLRYTTARRMGMTCIRCHNTHTDSPRTDWREGDVRGVLEIIRPLYRDIERTHRGLRGTFVLIATVALTLFAIGMVTILVERWRRRGVVQA